MPSRRCLDCATACWVESWSVAARVPPALVDPLAAGKRGPKSIEVRRVRSLNVKKVAASAAGLALVGAALAGAVQVDSSGLSSFPFFTNGEPNVKVVVGSGAAASDAVAAGNIAAMLGNLAYNDQPVTVLGIDQLSCGAGGAAGSCDLTNKQVVLTVTTPGVNPASAFSMTTYVNDRLDYNPDTTRSLTTSFSGLTNTSFGSTTGPKVVTKDLTAVLAPHKDLASDGKIDFHGKTGTTSKEEQKIYLYANTQYDTNAKKLMAKDSKTAYEAIFADPIPLCLDTSKNSTNCAESNKVSKNNVRITFLGDKWTLMDYTSNAAGYVSQVVLGKEIQHKEIMRVGDSATTPDGYTITLVDLSGFGYGTGGTSLPRVSFTVADKDGNVIKQITVDEGSGSTTISEANNLVVKVNKAFPGAFAKEAYADVSLFSNKLDLTNNQEISGAVGGSKGWRTIIVSGVVGSSDAISKIQVYNDIDQTYKSPMNQDLAAGTSIDMIKGIPGYKFNFLGLETPATDSLTFTVQKDLSLAFNNGTWQHTARGDFMSITSGRSNAFQLAKNVATVYVLLSTTNSSVAISKGQAFYYDENANVYISNQSTSSGAYVFLNGTGLSYYYSATETANITANFSFQGASGAGGNTTTGNNHTVFILPEITEDANGTAAGHGNNNFHWNIQYDGNLRQLVNSMASTTVDKIGYDDLNPFTATNATMSLGQFDPGYTSRRGGVFNSISSSSVSFNYPMTIAHAKYTLTAAGVSASANEADYTLAEGDSKDIGGGYSVKVKEIMADAAVAEEDTGVAPGLSGTDSLRPSVANAAVVTELSGPMVLFDNDPAASATDSLVLVGGPAANSLTQRTGIAISQGSDAVVKVMGSKVVVAGYTAADTQTAATALVSWLADNRDAVRG